MNCLIFNNQANVGAGVHIYASGDSTSIINSTIVENTGAGFELEGGDVVNFINSITRDNTVSQLKFRDQGDPTVSFQRNPFLKNIIQRSCFLRFSSSSFCSSSNSPSYLSSCIACSFISL